MSHVGERGLGRLCKYHRLLALESQSVALPILQLQQNQYVQVTTFTHGQLRLGKGRHLVIYVARCQ